MSAANATAPRAPIGIKQVPPRQPQSQPHRQDDDQVRDREEDLALELREQREVGPHDPMMIEITRLPAQIHDLGEELLGRIVLGVAAENDRDLLDGLELTTLLEESAGEHETKRKDLLLV